MVRIAGSRRCVPVCVLCSPAFQFSSRSLFLSVLYIEMDGVDHITCHIIAASIAAQCTPPAAGSWYAGCRRWAHSLAEFAAQIEKRERKTFLRLRPSAPGTPLPIPSAARRSALASPAAPTGDLARRCTPLRCLRQAQCLPLPHTCLPHLPTFPTAYTHLPTHPRRRPTAPIPPDDATRPAPALPDRPLTPSPPSETAST